MTKAGMVKIGEKYGYTFKETWKDGYVLENTAGHKITAPTLKGLHNCFKKWVIEKEGAAL